MNSGASVIEFGLLLADVHNLSCSLKGARWIAQCTLYLRMHVFFISLFFFSCLLISLLYLVDNEVFGRLPACHGWAWVWKDWMINSVCSWLNARYSLYSGLPRYIADFGVMTTGGGDNNVITQQTGVYLAKTLASVLYHNGKVVCINVSFSCASHNLDSIWSINSLFQSSERVRGLSVCAASITAAPGLSHSNGVAPAPNSSSFQVCSDFRDCVVVNF